MKLSVIEGNTQRLDGGAMFGNAPREMWKWWAQVDHQNRITLATRCLLWELDDGRRVLFEAGIGTFFEPKYRERYGIMQDEHQLLKNLEAQGLTDADIDCVILSHMHFDHAGGLFATWDGSPPRLLFPNATFYTGKRQWEHACHPHPRDRASYVPETLELLKASGRLRLIEGETHPDLDFPVSFLFFDGHTPGMAVSRLALPHGVLYFVADLIPGAAWVHIPIVMGYDRFAELTIDEKTAFLGRVMQEDAKLYFTHDPLIACAGVDMDEKGRYTAFASDIERLVLSEVAQ